MNYLAENRSMNWAGVPDSAPGFVKRYVQEYRVAQLAKRSISPVFLKSHTAGIEQRAAVASATPRTVTRLFPMTKRHAVAPTNEDAALRSIAHRQKLELHNDLMVLRRARFAAEEKREAAELAERVAEFHSAVWPWERRS